jgi:protocatechuate 3,4-dioxygenase beta subunit
MKSLAFTVIFFQAVAVLGQQGPDRPVGGPCEQCDLIFESMPEKLSSRAVIASAAEPGEPLEISGTIYKADGRTPAGDVILYVYHTDSKGEYAQSPEATRDIPHGRLRGWMKTDQNGKYFFRTIRPASYPNSRAPQHIHPLIKEPGLETYWIDEYVFEDDPFVGQQYRESQRDRGGSGLIKLIKDNRGVWVGRRDIILGKNIPNYQAQTRP